MRNLSCHFQKHSHPGHGFTHCGRDMNWSRGMGCPSKGQSLQKSDPKDGTQISCTGHHHCHRPMFQKWGSMNLKRKIHPFRHGHHSHSHHHNHHHHHHSHPQWHGQRQSCQHRNEKEQPMRHGHKHAHECCSLECQTKACQTDPVLEEAQEAIHSEPNSVDTETEEVQAST